MMNPLVKKLLRNSAITLFFVFFLLFSFIALLDPNQFKASITKQVAQITGRELEIHGPMTWHFDPHFSVEMYDGKLNNPSSIHHELLAFKKLRIETRLLPLLIGQLQCYISLDSVEIKVVKNIFGENNWSALLQEEWSSLPRYIPKVVPKDITLKNAQISYYTQDSKVAEWSIKELSLSAPRIDLALRDNPAPILISGLLEFPHQTKTPEPFSVQGKWTLSQEVINLSDFEMLASHSQTKAKGELTINNVFLNPQVQARIQMSDVDGQSWFPDLLKSSHPIHLKTHFTYQNKNLDVHAFSVFLNQGASLEGSLKATLQQDLSQTHSHGYLKGTHICIADLPPMEISTFFDSSDGKIELHDIDATIGDTKHTGALTIDIRDKTPQWILSHRMTASDINQVFSWIGQNNKVSGRALLTSQLHTVGKTPTEWMNHLSGQSKLIISEGKILGIDLYALLKHAQGSVLKLSTLSTSKEIDDIVAQELSQWQHQAQDPRTLSTPFKRAQGTAMIEEGKIQTPELKISHPNYELKSQGYLDLPHHEMKLQSQVTWKLDKKELEHLANTPLLINIQGKLDNLTVQPNIKRYAEQTKHISPNSSSKPVLVKTPSSDDTPPNEFENLFGLP